jgi:hypothetical protein
MFPLIYLALAAIALSCNPPLSDFKYIGNATDTALDLIEGLTNQAGMG